MGQLFKSPKMPAIEPPTPLPDQKQVTDARRRRIATETGGNAVGSTILSGAQRETLGA